MPQRALVHAEGHLKLALAQVHGARIHESGASQFPPTVGFGLQSGLLVILNRPRSFPETEFDIPEFDERFGGDQLTFVDAISCFLDDPE